MDFDSLYIKHIKRLLVLIYCFNIITGFFAYKFNKNMKKIYPTYIYCLSIYDNMKNRNKFPTLMLKRFFFNPDSSLNNNETDIPNDLKPFLLDFFYCLIRIFFLRDHFVTELRGKRNLLIQLPRTIGACSVLRREVAVADV